MNEPEHKEPCPFCGTDTDLSVQPDRAEDDGGRVYAYHVHCGVCGCDGRNNYPIGWCETPEAAWEAWNHRGSVRPQVMHEANRSQQYSIEPHGPEGQFALYLGRDRFRHGANLCALYDFDRNGAATRKAIVDALNANAHLKEHEEFRADELDAVMVSVDKWFEDGDPRLKNNPATRAADAREIALKALDESARIIASLRVEVKP